MNERPLAGVGVLVTRPAHQSAEMIEAIEAEGGRAHRFPVIDVIGRDAAAINSDVASQQTPDIVIYVSANAVRHGLPVPGELETQVAAIGPATAGALRAAGIPVDIRSASGYNSEHLLATEALKDVGGKTITIVRGDSGRELLAETLRHRGATVQYLSVYRTEPHRFSQSELEAVERAWTGGEIDAVMIMSVATLDSLLEALPTACLALLPDTRLVGPSERVIQTALERSPGATCVLSPGPGAADMVSALIGSLHKHPDSAQ